MITLFSEKRNIKNILFFSFLLIVLVITPVSAQMNARAVGLGGAYTAIARGVNSPLWNPANLGLSDNPKFSMTIIGMQSGAWNNSFSLGMYNKYNGEYWTDKDIEDILNSIPDNGFRSNTEVLVNALSFSAGRFALTIGVIGGGYVNAAKTLFEIPLTGTKINKLYEFNDTDGSFLAAGMVGVSWGQPLKVDFAEELTVGGTVNLFFSGAYANADTTEFSINSKPYGMDLKGSYAFTYAYNSSMGFGLSLGSAARLNKKWSVSIGLTNIFNSIPFNKDVKTEKGTFALDSLNVLTDFEEDARDTTWTVDASSFSARFPAVLHLGCAYREGAVLMSADYHQVFTKGIYGSTNPQLSVGTEWQGVSWFPLRMGVVMGGYIGFGTSFGFGIRPGGFVLDIGYMSRGFLISPHNTKGMIVSLDLGINLQKKK
ncbi:MAG: hypothetical protein R6V04_14790 [bacterium]